MFRFISRYNWNKDTSYQKFALVAGAIFFLIGLTPLQELDANRTDNPQGMLLVGVTALILLVLLRKKLKQIS
jgi:hypothetical protein